MGLIFGHNDPTLASSSANSMMTNQKRSDYFVGVFDTVDHELVLRNLMVLKQILCYYLLLIRVRDLKNEVLTERYVNQ